jgi:hypothetical protein
VALCLLFVGSGVALTIHYLSDASSRPAEDDKNDGHPVALAPVGKPPKPHGQKHQRPPTAAQKKHPGLKQSAIEAALPQEQGNLAEKKLPAPAKEVSAEKPKPGASGQQAKRRPTAPEPPVPPARLRGSRPLGNHLVTAAVPKPLGKAARKGLAWLARQQQKDGGWSEGIQSIPMGNFGRLTPQVRRRLQALTESNVPDTSIATLALLRSGSTPKHGPHANQVRRGVEFICSRVEKADEDSLSLRADPFNPTPTLVQQKLGAHADTFLATLLLAEVRGRMPDERSEQRVRRALRTLVAKMEKHQQKDGTWPTMPSAGNFRAALATKAGDLGQALAAKALHRACQAGCPVSESVLARAKKYAEQNLDSKKRHSKLKMPGLILPGKQIAVVLGDTLYTAAATLSSLQDSLNTQTSVARRVRKLAPSAVRDSPRKGVVPQRAPSPDTRLTRTKVARAADLALKHARSGRWFQHNGGEEILSYMYVSEALAVGGGKRWKGWDKAITTNLTRAQNKEGSWSGFHCILGKTFCTAASLLTLMADRAPVHEAVKIAR